MTVIPRWVRSQESQLVLEGNCLVTAAYAAASPPAEAPAAEAPGLAPHHRRLAPLQACAANPLPIVDVWDEGELELRIPRAASLPRILLSDPRHPQAR